MSDLELIVTEDGSLLMRPPPELLVDEHVLMVVDMPDGASGLTCTRCEWEESGKPDTLAGELNWLAQEHWLERSLAGME